MSDKRGSHGLLEGPLELCRTLDFILGMVGIFGMIESKEKLNWIYVLGGFLRLLCGKSMLETRTEGRWSGREVLLP